MNAIINQNKIMMPYRHKNNFSFTGDAVNIVQTISKKYLSTNNEEYGLIDILPPDCFKVWRKATTYL